MVFSSPEFVYLFLPLVLLSSAALRAVSRSLVAQNALLTAASLWFYAWGSGPLVGLLLFSIAANHLLGAAVARSVEGARRRWVAVAVLLNLGVLGYFKYANFFVAEVLGAGPSDWEAVALPIGISFYTFQAMSYVFDVYRGDAAPARTPLDFALYVSSFPQLIAGPIVRYKLVARQLVRRSVSLDDLCEGALRVSLGLVKKVVVADSIAGIADAAFATPPGELGAAAAWLGLVAYTFQIYFDFSGYSDMAIGLGRLFGFRFPENFDRPYSALSVTDFWRRWHMTLSGWFRDYVYLPLGGSRRGTARTYANLVLVFLTTGLWHGANWTFLLWGALHGSFLILERVSGQRPVESASREPLRRALTFSLVMLAWVVFRSDDVGHALGYYAALFRFGDASLPVEVALAAGHKSLWVLALAATSVALPRDFHGRDWILRDDRPGWVVQGTLVGIGLPLVTLLLASQTYSPFLYFQF